jgi:CRP/FNR family transcriptional regulator
MLAHDRRPSEGAIFLSVVPEVPTLPAVFRFRHAEKASAGESLVRPGDPATHVFLIESGYLRVTRLLPDGRRVITGFLGSGSIVGLSLKDRYMYGVEALDDVVFRRMKRQAFDEEAMSPPLHPELLSRLRDEMTAAQDQMVLLACKSADERVCSFLLQRLEHGSANPAGRRTVVLPMTRLDIADYLGLTIETVSRTITRLAKKGIIATEGRQGIRIENLDALVQRAGDGEEWAIGTRRHAQATAWPN